jgi:hypothetical protein
VVITLVWDEHFVSVGSKQIRKPKKDGWFGHEQNCHEYLETQLRLTPYKPKRAFAFEPPPAVPLGGHAWMA